MMKGENQVMRVEKLEGQGHYLSYLPYTKTLTLWSDPPHLSENLCIYYWYISYLHI